MYIVFYTNHKNISINMRALMNVYIHIAYYVLEMLDARSLKILLDLLDLELQITMHSLQLGSKVLVGPWGAKRRTKSYKSQTTLKA